MDSTSEPTPTPPNHELIRNPLLIPELFHLILNHVATQKRFEEPRDIRRALYALALTRRELSSPSLECLWKELDSLKPLIRCYGGDVQISPQTPPSSADWKIIRKYSPQIRKLELKDLESMLFLQCIGTQSSSLLPKLSSLSFDSTQVKLPNFSASILLNLLSSELVTLNVNFDNQVRAEGLQAFLEDLRRCPKLEYLCVRPQTTKISTEERRTPFTTLSSVLCLLRDLQHVELLLPIKVDHIALEILFKSSKLKHLDVTVYDDRAGLLEATLNATDIPLRNVKVLLLTVPRLEFVTNLLRVSDQAFDHVRIHLEGGPRPTPPSLRAFFNALSSPRRNHSLQSIQLVRFPHDENSPRTDCLSADILSPLASFHRLNTLEVDLGNISIDDGELVVLARQWPSLHVLRLTCDASTWPSAKHPTLKGTISLIKSCQQLIVLVLSIDAREVPQTTDVDADVRKIKLKLYELGFPNSPIEDPRLVADFFSEHSISANNFRRFYFGPYTSPWKEYEERWNEVAWNLKEMVGR